MQSSYLPLTLYTIGTQMLMTNCIKISVFISQQLAFYCEGWHFIFKDMVVVRHIKVLKVFKMRGTQ